MEKKYNSPTANIKGIELDFIKGEKSFNDVPLVKMFFDFPCTWTVLHSEDLKEILKLWIQGEKKKLNGKYQDAYWLQNLILDVFKEENIIFGKREVKI